MFNKEHTKLVFEVTKWEFLRWFKIKEHLITILVSAVLSLVFFGGKTLVNKFTDSKINIVYYNNSNIDFRFNKNENLKIKKVKTPIEVEKKLLKQKKLDGILVINSIDSCQLFVNKKSVWINELESLISKTRTQLKIKEANIPPEKINDIFKLPIISYIYTDITKTSSSAGDKIMAGIFIGLMLVGIFLGLAYQFVAITGEKQLRITEVIVSAISPQTWIDGKIIGISLLSITLMATYALSSIVFVSISLFFGSGWSFPLSITNPVLIVTLFTVSMLGFLFWNTFFSAIAATINDPNTSARGSLIMVPLIPIVIAFMAFKNPDSFIMTLLSIFPLTSPPILAVRLVLSDVPVYQTILAIVLLLLSIYYLRKAAGKIFEVSILMYGKELSWKEISRWIKN